MKFIINNMLIFADGNLEVAETSIIKMIQGGDLSVNGDIDSAEQTLKSIIERTKNIKEKISKLKEINTLRIDFLNKVEKIL